MPIGRGLPYSLGLGRPNNKPLRGARVDPTHPLAPTAFWAPNADGLMELRRGIWVPPAATSKPAVSGGRLVQLITGQGGTNPPLQPGNSSNAALNLGTTAGITIAASYYNTFNGAMILSRPGSPVQDFGILSSVGSNSGVRFGTSATYATALIGGTAGNNGGTLATIFGSWDGATIRSYANGVAGGTIGLNGVLRDSGGSVFLGGDAGGNGMVNGAIEWAAIWPRALSAAEVLSITNSPYQFLAPSQRRMFALLSLDGIASYQRSTIMVNVS